MTRLLASPLRNLLAGLAFMLAVCAAATAAYMEQGWSFGDALYMVVITIYTVGYGETRPVDTSALRAITLSLIATGCTGMIFLTGALVQLITLSQLQHLFGNRRMQKDIDALRGHVIVCGYGRIGQMVARELRDGQMEFVVLDRGEARLAECRRHGFFALQGDATDEEVLKSAGIARARALATVLPDDAANVFITLSARSLNRELTIIARGEAPSTETKLLQAGADRVVLPTHIGAERIAELILFRDVAALLEGGPARQTLGRDLRRLGLDLEIVAAAEGSRAAGASIADIEAEAGGAFPIVALNRREGESLLQPAPATVIGVGDGVAVVGRPGRAQAMQTLFAAHRPPAP